MTFHAPQSSARLISMVARRLVFCRASFVTVGAIVSTTVVLAGRGGDPVPDETTNALPAQSKPLAVASLDPTAGVDGSTFASLLKAPDDLQAGVRRDKSLLIREEDKSVGFAGTPGRATQNVKSLRDTLPALLDFEDPEETSRPKTFEVARLQPPEHDWGTLDSLLTPRLPEVGPVPLTPPVSALPDTDVVPEIDGHESGPKVVTLTAKVSESLEEMLERGGLREEDRRATLIALRADKVAEDLIEGDMIDVAFLAEDDDQLLAVRMRQLGQPPIELRWDGQTDPLWDPLVADLAPAETKPALPQPENLSITGRQDDTIFVSGMINSSLYASAAKAGLTAGETKALTDIFRYSVDFERDLRKGDRFEAMFEKGPNGSYGNVLYAKLNNRGSEIALYRGIDDATGEVGYFDASGKTNKRSLMRTPLAGARVSSHFGMRHHPVLGYSKMHRGTDFSAPQGTPIFAAGDGILEYVGRKGAYGKYIRIRHNGVYETAYAHLSRYSPGLASGQRVRQGDVIGYVGSTGRSTGPHLHFEILEHGGQINPMKIADFGPTRGLTGPALSRFKVRVSRIEIALTLVRNGNRLASSN